MTTRNELAELARTKKQPWMTNETYNVLKQCVQVGLPACGTLYAALAVFWGWGYGREVVGSIAALTVFGGVWLTILGWRYANSDAKYDGIVVTDTTDPEKDVVKMLYNSDPAEIASKKEVTFKVVDHAAEPEDPEDLTE